MSYISARMFAAVFRSVGIDAYTTPASNEQTLELGALHTSGEECYPAKITIGDFLRIVHSDDFDPRRNAFFMPMAEGPCRFGQYSRHLRQVLDELGYADVPIISPCSKNGYAGLAEHAGDMVRRLWQAMVTAEILTKMLLKTRPYETSSGQTDEVYERGMDLVESVMEVPGVSARQSLKSLVEVLAQVREMFRKVPARYTKDRPLIGLVGEIFCRLNEFTNYEAIRKIEAHGGEVWLSDVCEWVWYTNWSQRDRLRLEGRVVSLEMLASLTRNFIQYHDERKLYRPFVRDFHGYEEPHGIYRDVLKRSWPYLPADGALGEMVLSVGKAVYVYNKGGDGIIDISPFSCMNGIVCEAVYHDVMRDHDNIPIRNFYFDATSSNIDRDLDIFMELAAGYKKRKKTRRRYPACFESQDREV